MTLTVERELTINGGKIRRLPLLAGAALPVRGALLSWDASGYVHALVAGEAFAGVCDQSARGGGFVDVVTGQFDLLSLAAIAGISLTDIAAGTQIYASDDATLTATSTGNTRIGAVAALDGVRVVVSAATINAAKAATVPVVIPPSDGALFGANTLVVSEDGDDTLGAASPYAAEFLTIAAAMAAASSPDVIVLRPGAYTLAARLTWQSGVTVYAMDGATINGAAAAAMFYDNGSGRSIRLTGRATLNVGAAGLCMTSGGGAQAQIECKEIYAPDTHADGLFQNTSSSPVSLSVDVETSITTNKSLMKSTTTGRWNGYLRADSITSAECMMKDPGQSSAFTIAARSIANTGNFLFSLSYNLCKLKLHADEIACQGIVYNGGANNYVDVVCAGGIANSGNAVCNFAGTSCNVSITARDLDSSNVQCFISQAGDNRVHARIADTLSSVAYVAHLLTAGSLAVDIRARKINGGAGIVARVETGAMTGKIEAGEEITGAQILVDAAVASAHNLSIVAPKITGTDAGSPHFLLKSTSADAVYDIRCPDLHAALDWQSSGKLILETGSHVSTATSLPALTLQGAAGQVFARTAETKGPASIAAIWLNGTPEVHLLGGRFIGGDGSANGVAMKYYGDDANVRLYPGAVLIGGDTAVVSIDIGGVLTPTVIAMGDIAANLDKHADVTIDVGTLLVDAAVA